MKLSDHRWNMMSSCILWFRRKKFLIGLNTKNIYTYSVSFLYFLFQFIIISSSANRYCLLDVFLTSTYPLLFFVNSLGKLHTVMYPTPQPYPVAKLKPPFVTNPITSRVQELRIDSVSGNHSCLILLLYSFSCAKSLSGSICKR